MKILSWDIGIKNLAYCLLDDFKILEWKNICLEDPPNICSGSFKNSNSCNRKATYILDNLYYCKTHSHVKSKLIKKKKGYDLLDIGSKLIKELEVFKNMELDLVLLENQPCLKNPTMKSIQMILFSNFLINGYPSSIKHVRMYSAMNKNRYCKNYCIKHNLEIPKCKNNYDMYKKTSIMVNQHILRDDDTWLSFFNNNKKKDDLADSYLMGIDYLSKKPTLITQ